MKSRDWTDGVGGFLAWKIDTLLEVFSPESSLDGRLPGVTWYEVQFNNVQISSHPAQQY